MTKAEQALLIEIARTLERMENVMAKMYYSPESASDHILLIDARDSLEKETEEVSRYKSIP